MKTAALSLAALALLLLSSEAAFACRCPKTAPSADLSPYAAVFSGQAVAVKFIDSGDKPGFEVQFEVGRVWKGELTKEATLVTRHTSCNFRFQAGDHYLVYAYASAGGAVSRRISARGRTCS